MKTLVSQMYVSRTRRALKRVQQLAALTALAVISHPVLAVLPTVTPPTGGDVSGSPLATFQGYVRDGSNVTALILGFAVLGAVAYATINKFVEYHRKKAELGEVVTVSGLGVVVAMFVTFVLTLAIGII